MLMVMKTHAPCTNRRERGVGKGSGGMNVRVENEKVGAQ